MVKTSELTNPYFSHDFYPQRSKKIVLLIDDMGYEGYGLYWKIVEFMHCNELYVGEEKLVAGKEWAEKVKKILTEFNLFEIVEGNKYFSDRILENITQQEEKGKKAKQAIESRWVLPTFASEYEKVFNIKPSLHDDEIETLKKLSKRISDFRKKLPAILTVLSKIKFDTKMVFQPRANWLLQDNHIHQILNGQYGPLPDLDKKSETTKGKDEFTSINNREEAIAYAVEHATCQQMQNDERAKTFMTKWNFTYDDFLVALNAKSAPDIDRFTDKSSALAYIDKNTVSQNFSIITPECKALMGKFDITVSELKKWRKENES